MKKVLSVILALVMALSVVSISAMAGKVIETDFTMAIGETRTVYFPGAVYDDYVIIRFAPLGSGKVIISSDSGEQTNADPALELYDEKMDKPLIKVDDNGSDRDFYLELNCEAGKVYYLVVLELQDATNWNIDITCLHEKYKDGVCMTCFEKCDHTIGTNLVGSCPCGENFTGLEIKDGDKISMVSNNQYFWFKFKPTETAAYLLTSDNVDDETTTAKSADPAVVVVDAKGENILVADDNISETDSNFALPYVFAEGESYFIGVYDNEKDSDSWTFALNKATSHTVEVEETVEKEDGTTETVANTVVHELTFIPATESTCQVAGHSSALYCKTCEKYLAGNHDYGVASECVDKNADNLCDWCSKVLVEEEPVECDCDCHKSGIDKFFFNFILFFQKIFRLNRYCPCGETHY